MMVSPITPATAAAVVVRHHYLHRRPPMSYAYGLHNDGYLVGVITFGTPASRHLQMSACPTDPAAVLELNRLWVADVMPRNTETWFVARALRRLPPRIIVSYADPEHGHDGTIYRAANFHYAGWTDMDRRTPRFDYVPTPRPVDDVPALIDGPQTPTAHTRDATRAGYVERRRRAPKVRYWTTTGNHNQRRHLAARCGWPVLDWSTTPPPITKGTTS